MGEHAEKDKERKAAIEAKNEADTSVYSAERNLEEHKEKLPADVVSEIEKAIADTREAMGGDDAEKIMESVNTLRKSLTKIGEALNKQAGSEQPEQAQDAEFTDADKDKREKDSA